MNKKHLGQYFTPAHVADFMVGLSTVSKGAAVLEPSAGEGVFLQSLGRAGFSNCIGFEVDDSLQNHSPFLIYHDSFVSHHFDQSFDLIIGNPPYIRWKNLDAALKTELEKNALWKKHFNSLSDYLNIFIVKSIELLREGGELIFITPEYWMNTTHAESLRNYLVENGRFESIYHFNETPVFDGVTSSVIIFKYRKTKAASRQTIRVVKFSSNRKLTTGTLQDLLNDSASENKDVFYIAPFQKNKRWILATDEIVKELQTYETHCNSKAYKNKQRQLNLLGDLVDIGNGMVSGLDKAFQLNGAVLNEKEKACLLTVAKAKGLEPYKINSLTEYIFLNDAAIVDEDELQNRYPAFFTQLTQHKAALQKRYHYNKPIQYWEWVFLRNYALFKKPVPKIFVPCKERISNKAHFRFALAPAGVFPTQDVTCLVPKADTKESIYYILALLNSAPVFDWMKYKGIVKGSIVEFSEKPLHNLPFRRIDWKEPEEVQLHEEITTVCRNLTEGDGSKRRLSELIEGLF